MGTAAFWSLILVSLPLQTGDAGKQAELMRRAVMRLSEEAEAFERLAPQAISRETLKQRAARISRFRPRIGAAAQVAPPPQYRQRTILSEYGYSVMKGEEGSSIHELRIVTSVDGRQARGAARARQTLTAGIQSDDDNVKKRLLEEFARHSLAGAVLDFGQTILLFSRRSLPDYSFAWKGESAGVFVLTYRQTGGQAMTVFEGRRMVRRAVDGELTFRAEDCLPLSVKLRTTRMRDGREIRDEAVVEYAMSRHGALLPSRVVHRQLEDEVLALENAFEYEEFRRFAADAEIKFEQSPDAPK